MEHITLDLTTDQAVALYYKMSRELTELVNTLNSMNEDCAYLQMGFVSSDINKVSAVLFKLDAVLSEANIEH